MTAWFFQNLAWASLVMMIALAVRRPVARLFGAGPAYALWLLPAARLIWPPITIPGTDELMPALDIVVPVGEAAAVLPPSSGDVAWRGLLLLIWAGGALLYLGWQFLAYRKLLQRLSFSSRSVGEHRGLPLIESTAVQGPMALGLLDPRIIVPADFARRYTPDERRLALEHEAIHHRRGDIWFNLAGMVVLAMNWFNPIAWVAFRAFREDQELACDAAVAMGADPARREDYARALVKSASRPGLIAACPLNHVDQLKRRLRMMKDHRRNRLRLIGGAATVAGLAAITATLGSASVAHPHPEGEQAKHRQRIMIIDTKNGEGADHARRLEIRRDPDGRPVVSEQCRDDNQLANVEDGDANRRVHMVICAHEGATAQERIDMLERARTRLSGEGDLTAEQRQRLVAALDAAIARLRTP